MASWSAEYLQTTIRRFRYYKELGERTFSQLNPEDFHFRPNKESNSIAVIIRHLSGNMISRWTDFLDSDGEKPYRNRDGEFEEGPADPGGLKAIWEQGWECLFGTLESLREEDLMKTVTIRGEGLSVMDAIQRQLAHYPYHVGQIIYLGKVIKDQDWNSLSIPRGASEQYNRSEGLKDPAKKFDQR
jgi:hypothetical protein